MSAVAKRRRFHWPKGRTWVRLGAMAAAMVLLAAAPVWPSAARTVPALSPFVAVTSAIATRSVGTATLVALPVLVLALFRRRWFCRWACPLGLLAETAGRLSPMAARRTRGVPSVGKAIVLASLAGAAVGYPLFLWLDPLAIFSGVFGLWYPCAAAAVAVGAVLVLSFVLPGVWCARLCPLGATQEWLVVLRKGWVPWPRLRGHAQVPENMPTASVGMAPESSNSHRLSSSVTPRRSVASNVVARRRLLTMVGGLFCAGIGGVWGWTAGAAGQGRSTATLRPPGAAPAWQMAQLCVRCGNCLRACPAGILRPDDQPEAAAGWLAPRVVFETDYCREDCAACAEACPSGAIRPFAPSDKMAAPIGLAHVDLERCLLALNHECRAMCVEACPYDAIGMHAWTFEDDRVYPIIAAENCPGCGACVVACRPMNAISVVPVDPS